MLGMADPDVFVRKGALSLRTSKAGAKIVETSSGFMLRLYVKFVGLALIAALPLAAQNAPKPADSSAKPAVHRVSKRKAKPVKPPAPPVPQPIPVMTPEQLPAAPPQVSYLNGQLTVQSQNATLGEVLNAIQKRTGASIDFPPGAGSERVAASLGPGPARDVVTQLLAGSRFDYVILGSNQYPGAIDRVVLTVRQGGPATTPATATNIPPQAYTPPANNAQVPPPDYNANPDAEDESAPDTAATPNPPPDEEQPPQPPQPPPGQQSPPPDQADQQQQQQQNPGVKTPEQLLQELQRLQQRDHSNPNTTPQSPGGQANEPGGQGDQSQGTQPANQPPDSNQNNPPR
jgi:hypothetical protein